MRRWQEGLTCHLPPPNFADLTTLDLPSPLLDSNIFLRLETFHSRVVVVVSENGLDSMAVQIKVESHLER